MWTALLTSGASSGSDPREPKRKRILDSKRPYRCWLDKMVLLVLRMRAGLAVELEKGHFVGAKPFGCSRICTARALVGFECAGVASGEGWQIIDDGVAVGRLPACA